MLDDHLLNTPEDEAWLIAYHLAPRRAVIASERIAAFARSLPLRAYATKVVAKLRFYEASHRAKNTAEADEKAEVNRKLAEEGEHLLGG